MIRKSITFIVFILEPGFYEDGAFGVRIENVELIRNVQTKYNFGGVQFLTMEPLTLVSLYDMHVCIIPHCECIRFLFNKR